MVKAHTTPGHIPHKTQLLMDLVIHHLLSYFRGNAMNSKNKLWAVLAIKSIDMNTSSVFVFGLKTLSHGKPSWERRRNLVATEQGVWGAGSWKLGTGSWELGALILCYLGGPVGLGWIWASVCRLENCAAWISLSYGLFQAP